MGWQAIAHSSFGGKNPHLHLLAHTDYDPEDKEQRDRLQQKEPLFDILPLSFVPGAVSQDSEEKIRDLEQQVRSLRQLIETIVDQVGRDAERITELEQEIAQLKRLIRESSGHGFSSSYSER